MFLLKWYREYLEIRDLKECQSCNTLREQLMMERENTRKLLDKIITPSAPPKIEEPVPPSISVPKVVPWHVKRQMLEQEDRIKAQALRNAPKSDAELAQEKRETEAFEKELKDASAAREAQTKNN